MCAPTSATLLVLADGRFPAGGHAHSAGVEAAVAIGDVHDGDTLERYLRGRLATTGVVEASVAAACCQAVRADADPVSADRDPRDRVLAACVELDRELDARILSPRARLVSRRLGRQLLRTARTVWPSPLLDRLADGHGPDGGDAVHQPVALGAAVAVAGHGPADAARLSLHHLGAAVTTAAVRLLGLDPMAAAALQVRVAPLVETTADRATRICRHPPAALPATGGALTEILAEHHGSWPARLFVG